MKNRLSVLFLVGLVFFSCTPLYAAKKIVVHLKNGNAMECLLVRENAKEITVNWQGGEIALGRNEIESIEGASLLSPAAGDGIVLSAHAKKEENNFKNNPVVRLTNGQILDEQITEVKPATVVLKKDLGGGAYSEREINRREIEALEFKPVHNPASDKIEAKLRELFPSMRFRRLGLVVLATDSQGSGCTTLERILAEQEMMLYFEFFDLFKNRHPAYEHYVVAFDKMSDYFQVADTDGVPAWICPGYFSPEQKVFYTVNFFGQDFTDKVYQIVKGARETIGQQASSLENKYGKDYKIRIQGLEKKADEKFESAMAYLAGVYTDISKVTLRHEFTHEFFHDWGLQTIVVSGMKDKNDDLLKKKRELFESKDFEKQKDLLIEILTQKRETDRDLKFGAANSWFVEGLAEYASTSLYDENNFRLFELKEARRKNELWPIEQLTVYKMGSFPGVAVEGALSGYAQSWSFVDFLMKRYRNKFLGYLERMSKETPAKGEDYQWLMQAVGKDPKTLEKEWQTFIDAMPPAEDPRVEQLMRVREILKR